MAPASHRQLFVANPLLLLTSAFALGVIISQTLSLKLHWLLISSAIFTLLSMVCVIKRRGTLGVIVLAAGFVFIGACFAIVETRFESHTKLSRLLDSGQIPIDKPIRIKGVVEGPVEAAPDALHLTLHVQIVAIKGDQHEANGFVAVTILAERDSTGLADELQLRHGASLRIFTQLNREARFRNPGVSGLTEYLDQKGNDATAVVKRPELIERLEDEKALFPLTAIYEWRRRLEGRVSRTFSQETAGVLNAAFLGNRYGLSRDISTKFREGGTFHVLVISGLHISFIGGVMFALMRRLTRNRLSQFLFSNLCLWAYTLAVGANSSVVRAAFMFSFVSFAPIVSRRAASLNALGLAALLLLVWRPRQLYGPSFQLTFLSVFAIVAFSWPLLTRLAEVGTWQPRNASPAPPRTPEWLRTLAEVLYWSEKSWQKELSQSTHKYKLFKVALAAKLERWRVQQLIRYAFTAVVISCSVQYTLLPFPVLHFHRLSLPAFILNIGVSGLMILLAGVAMLALVVSGVSSAAAGPLIQITEALNWLMMNSIVPFSRVHLASIRIPEYAGRAAWVYPLYFLPLICLAIALAKWNPLGQQASFVTIRGLGLSTKLMLAIQLFLAFAIVVHPFSVGRTKLLRLDFLDVGQGDAALVTMPNGATFLVDGGGQPDFRRLRETEPFARDTRTIGEGVVSEFLWHRGLDRIDYILATHADADHIDGLNDVAQNFYVRAALIGRTPPNDLEFERFRATTTAQSLPLVTVTAGDTLKFGDVSMDVIWPPSRLAPGVSSNNDSLVLSIKFANRSILMTGDIEAAAEGALVRSVSNLNADIVKVAHHGSKTSSTGNFVSATTPSYAVISVGRRSMFGHPHEEVLKRWEEAGAKVLTTGKCGTITIETDGNALKVTTFVQSQECRYE